MGVAAKSARDLSRWVIVVGSVALLTYWNISYWRHDLGVKDLYIIPLFGQYAVQANGPGISNFGRFQIAKIDYSQVLSPDWPDPWVIDQAAIVPDVTKFAVQGHLIAGQTTLKYFLYDTDHSDFKFYDNPNEFDAALARAGIANIQLNDPDSVAAGLPAEVIHPWAFVYMHNRWGHSDYWWSGFFIQCAFVASLVAGLVIPRGRKDGSKVLSWIGLLVFAIVLGWHENVLTNSWIPDSNAMAFPLGAVLSPIICVFGALWGRLIGNLILGSLAAGAKK